MSDMMTFPATVEEFMEQYKIVDDEKVYTNGAELIPIFRMMQWFEHVSATDTISRQAAIDAVTDELDMIDHVPQWVFDRLEGRLKQLPPAQLGTNLAEVGTEERAEERTETHACDCINRQQAIDEIDEWIKAFRENGHKESAADACLIQDGIIQLPPAQPEQCTGKWIRNGWAITCSECGYDMPYTVRNFCPNCGADMRGEQG